MKTGQALFLGEEQVRQYLRMEELIPAMEKALIGFSSGQSDSAGPVGHYSRSSGRILWNDAGAHF